MINISFIALGELGYMNTGEKYKRTISCSRYKCYFHPGRVNAGEITERKDTVRLKG